MSRAGFNVRNGIKLGSLHIINNGNDQKGVKSDIKTTKFELEKLPCPPREASLATSSKIC